MLKRLSLGACGALLLMSGFPALAEPDVAVFTRSDAEAVLDEEPRQACDASADGCAAAAASVPTRSWRFGGQRPQAQTGVPVAAPTGNLVPPRRNRLSPASVGTTVRRAVAPRLLPLQFALGSAELSTQSRDNLKTLAEAMQEPGHAQKHIRITGHTDKSGSVEVNQRLSLERAQAAAAYIASLGVEPGRVETAGMAFEAPLPGMSLFDPRNRRVEVERTQ